MDAATSCSNGGFVIFQRDPLPIFEIFFYNKYNTMKRLFKYLNLVSWILAIMIFLSFGGYLFWLNSIETIFLGFTGIMFLPQIFWVGYYWIILIVTVIIFVSLLVYFRKKRGWINFNFLVGLFSVIIWLIIPFLRDSSIMPEVKKGEISRLTSNLKKTYNPATRINQISNHMWEGGCKYWLEGWSEDGQYLKISERSYGSRQCLDQDTFVIDIRTREKIQAPDTNFIPRADDKTRTSLLDDYLIKNDSYLVYDIFPSPEEKNYAVVLGKNSLTGPHEIFIFKLD